MTTLLDQFKPEYLHILLNPYISHGLPLSLFALLLAFLTRDVLAIRLSLVLVILTALLIYPIAEFGEAGYDRMSAVVDDLSQEWLDNHLARAQTWLPLFYGVAAVAFVALISSWKRRSVFLMLTGATLLVGFCACIAAAYIGYAGGKVSHPELRPKVKSQEGVK